MVILERAIPMTPRSDLGPYTIVDYHRLPDDERCQLIYGRLVVTPSPVVRHQVVAAALFRVLDDVAREVGGLAIIAPIDVHLAPHSVVQPDVLYLSADRRHIAETHIAGVPDLVIEVVSPGSYRMDRGEKLRLYAESGVTEYWIVDPDRQDVEFLVNADGEMMVRLPVDGLYVSAAEPELRLDVPGFWEQVEERMGS